MCFSLLSHCFLKNSDFTLNDSTRGAPVESFIFLLQADFMDREMVTTL